MTYKQAYGLINPEVRTLEEVIYWVNNYKLEKMRRDYCE